MANGSTSEALFNFGVEARKKLDHNNTFAHAMLNSIKAGNRHDLSHHFLLTIVSAGLTIPLNVSEVLLDVLSKDKDVSEFHPFVMGMIG